MQFAKDGAEVKVYDLGLENNHKTADKAKEDGAEATVTTGEDITEKAVITTDDGVLKVVMDDVITIDEEAGTIAREKEEVKALRGHFVRVEFKAQLADDFDIDALKKEVITENKPLDTTAEQATHEGIPNKASYEIEVGNEGKYSDESNTVTVRPEEPEIEKYINTNVHKDIEVDEVFTYDIIAYITNDADKVIISDDLNEQLQFAKDGAEVKVYDLGLENNHKTADKAKEDGAEATVTTGEDITDKAEITAEGNALRVVLDDVISIDEENGIVKREKDNVKNLRGHYVRVEFKAQLADGVDIDALATEVIEDNEPLDVTDDQAKHTGIPNKARYEIEVENEGKYSDESNIVTVQPEKPEIEKYVNQAVHKDIELEEEFTYDIIAYVTKDAESVTITDELDKQLEFVSKEADVKVVDLGEDNNHKVTNNISAQKVNDDATVAEAGKAIKNAKATIANEVLTVEIPDASANRGHWVKVTFTAKIKKGLDVEDLKLTAIDPKAEEDRDAPNIGNDPVVSDEAHEGVPNKAAYTISVGNKARYKDESNTVTVKPEKPEEPEKPEIEKYVNQAVHQFIEIDEEFTYDIIAYVTKDADSVTITDTLEDILTFVSTEDEIIVEDLGPENNHKVTNDVFSDLVNTDATVGRTDGTKVVCGPAIVGQTLAVEIADATAYRGHWIRVTFTCKIADGKTQEEVEACFTHIEKNDPVLSDEDHKGIPNDASYEINVGGEVKYKDESNTVTVNPFPDFPDDEEKDKPDEGGQEDTQKPEQKTPTTPDKPSNDKPSQSVKTGDESNPILWLGIFFLGAAFMLIAKKGLKK